MESSDITSKFQFKHFTIHQNDKVMKVCTDSCILGALAEPLEATRILDIGTGTGLLSLMMAQKSKSLIDAVDIDHEACKVAIHNISQTKFTNRIRVIEEDIQLFSSGAEEDYDFIISNPPFYSNMLPPSQASKILYKHGFSLNLTQLLQSVLKMLERPHGKFWLLLPPAETEYFERIAYQAKFYPQIKYFIRDRLGSPVIRVVTCFSFESAYMLSEEVIIHDENGDYTRATENLLTPYYLYM